TRMEMRWFATYDFSLTGSGTECRKQRLKAAGELAGLMPLATTSFSPLGYARLHSTVSCAHIRACGWN
ncbi:hypothetical protein, partial [Ralstonia pseudosolanacearum]|uniref:hypothetical protein n=1 Tax=Ralstonia pseudosolanacearum TaxID=1310165 RepID=UPI003D014DAC